MTVSELVHVLNGYPDDTKVFVGDKLDNTVLSQQVIFDISHYLDLDGAFVEDASLCIISEKR